MRQPHRIFHISDILEEILLHLDPTTLLLSQRVCTLWHILIKGSSRCQTALFFKPSTSISLAANRTLNPFFNTSLRNHFLRNRLSRPPPRWKTFSQMQSDRAHTFSRPEASWREMLLQQPPALRVGVVETHHQGTERVAVTRTAFQPGGEFIRMKDIEGPVNDGILLPARDCPVFWTDCACRPSGQRFPWGHWECGKEVARRQLSSCDLVVIAEGPFRLPIPGLAVARGEERVPLMKWLESLVEMFGVVQETREEVYMQIGGEVVSGLV